MTLKHYKMKERPITPLNSLVYYLPIKVQIAITNRKISRFFGCPSEDFYIEFKPAEKNEEVYKSTIGLGNNKTEQTFNRSGHVLASFEPDDNLNILSFSSIPDFETIEHEVLHGHHYRSNKSIRDLKQTVKSIVGKAEKCEDEMPSDDDLIRLINSTSLYQFGMECITSGYERLKEIKNGKSSWRYSLELNLNPLMQDMSSYAEQAVNAHRRCWNSLVRLQDLEDLTENGICDLSTIRTQMAYSMGFYGAINMFIDKDKEPECETVLVNQKKALVLMRYSLLNIEEAEEQMRSYFRKDLRAVQQDVEGHQEDCFKIALEALQARYQRYAINWNEIDNDSTKFNISISDELL